MKKVIRKQTFAEIAPNNITMVEKIFREAVLFFACDIVQI